MKDSLFNWIFENKGLPTVTLIILLCAFVYIGVGLLIAFAPQIKEITQNFDLMLMGITLIGMLK